MQGQEEEEVIRDRETLSLHVCSFVGCSAPRCTGNMHASNASRRWQLLLALSDYAVLLLASGC